MKQVIVALAVALLIAAVPAGTALAHTHLHLPNGNCINIPAHAYGDGENPFVSNPGNAAEHAHEGIAIARDHNNMVGGLCESATHDH